MKIFAERLKKLRIEKNISAMALSKVIGVSGATIIRWETHKCNTTGKNFAKLAKFFGVSTDYLFGLKD
ncbi:MAG: helix-turn-helix domain-containing protein [Firmicutes bacterium]|nr:helix-turn-helix domain-containing protein [Bacillota bacterium]